MRGVHLGVEDKPLATQLEMPELERDSGDRCPAGLQRGQVEAALRDSHALDLGVGGRHIALLGHEVLLGNVYTVGLFRLRMEDLADKKATLTYFQFNNELNMNKI